MLWNDYSFCLKVVFYQATFIVFILQPMPLSNLSIRTIFYDSCSKLFLTHPALCGRRLVYATQCFCGVSLSCKN